MISSNSLIVTKLICLEHLIVRWKSTVNVMVMTRIDRRIQQHGYRINTWIRVEVIEEERLRAGIRQGEAGCWVYSSLGLSKLEEIIVLQVQVRWYFVGECRIVAVLHVKPRGQYILETHP